MNEDTRQFLEDTEFDTLHAQLSATHRPIKPDIAPERLIALGLLVVRFQRLEFTIRSFIRFLSHSPDQTLLDILTVKYSFKNLIFVLSSLAKHQGFPHPAELELLLKRCFRAEAIRNQLLHSSWTSDRRLKVDLSKHGIQYKWEEYSVAELEDLAAAVDKLDTAMEALMFRWLEALGPRSPAPPAP